MANGAGGDRSAGGAGGSGGGWGGGGAREGDGRGASDPPDRGRDRLPRQPPARHHRRLAPGQGSGDWNQIPCSRGP